MHLRLLAAATLVAAALAPTAVAGANDAREAAGTFARALTSSDPRLLRTVLPTEGKVRLRLVRMGPEEGVFGPGQVEAVFRDFLAHGSLRSFELSRLDARQDSFALAHATALVVDRRGRTARVGLHLALQFERGRWVIREIKETSE